LLWLIIIFKFKKTS